MNRKIVDVIIPTYKPDETFDRLMKRLSRQTYPVRSIYIVNTEEKFFRPEYVKDYPNVLVEHISQQKFDHGGTRDMAARKSDADIVVFMTQDAMPEDEFVIEKLTECFDDSDIGAAYARQLPADDCNEIERFTRSFNYPEKSSVKSLADIDRLGIKTYFCSNVCAAYEKELYTSLGGFIRHTIFNEDMIFASKIIRSGKKIAYCAEARVVHSHNYTNKQQLKRNFDLGVSQQDNADAFYGLKSEGEGIKLVMQTAKHCFKIKKPFLIFDLFFKSGFKYIGYWLGKHYASLPQWLIYRLTMNLEYWN
ncbi:glycosyltransferase [Konateibacter massiliensis]|uniref:glycosyltransferase n=1 Tax=Konateibacter massiliensis TaxID=2002841 RepID=UPI000C14DD80|nr:glycosyltransferase family 2 protein [Konateibacter massiliensis]